MTDGLEEVPAAPRRAKARGSRATVPADMPGWLADLGDPGGMRFRLVRVDPNVRSWPPTPRAINYDEIERNGPGIYEVQTEQRDARNVWRPYGRPRQVTIEAAQQVANANPAPAGDIRDEIMRRFLDGLDAQQHAAPAFPPNPYTLPGGPAVPADTLDELKATHRETVAELKASHRETMETQRMLWEDRLTNSHGNAEALKAINESRVRELEERLRRIEGELSEARSNRGDPLAEAVKRMEDTERLREAMGGTKDPDEHWITGLLRNPEAVGQIIERIQPPQPKAAAHPVGHQADRSPANVPPAVAADPALEQRKAGLVEALEKLLSSGASASQSYAQLAPHVGIEALTAAASVEPAQFVADLVRPSPPASRLRDPEATAWLEELHQIIRRVTSGPASAPASVQAGESAPVLPDPKSQGEGAAA